MIEEEKDLKTKRILPPPGLFARLRHYGSRYGYLHAIASYLGRHYYPIWRLLGPYVTRGYIRRWISSPSPHILNLGGGSVLHQRWLTADVDPRSDVWTDITEPLPFSGSSIDVIYLEEVIEHVNLDQGARLLLECARILKPGGVLRITTPSLDHFVSLPLSNPESTLKINDIFYLHGHRHIFSESELKALLGASGFSEVVKSCYLDSESRYGYFDTHPVRFPFAVAESSQYWECLK